MSPEISKCTLHLQFFLVDTQEKMGKKGEDWLLTLIDWKKLVEVRIAAAYSKFLLATLVALYFLISLIKITLTVGLPAIFLKFYPSIGRVYQSFWSNVEPIKDCNSNV